MTMKWWIAAFLAPVACYAVYRGIVVQTQGRAECEQCQRRKAEERKRREKDSREEGQKRGIHDTEEREIRREQETPEWSAQQDKTPILFYERGQPYYEFTNFAPYTVEFDGKVYPTSEHLFQAYKFLNTRPELAERIRSAPSPREALEEATRMRKLQRSDWFDVNIGVMEQLLEAKFTQHTTLRDLLLGTGEREIVEASPVDAFWGFGKDRQGRNELGKALMRLRDKLRKGEDRQTVVPKTR